MAYWGLTLLPFENVVDKRFFYESEYHSEALLRLNYCTSSRKGAAVLIGDIGCGKTLINQLYIDSLPRDKYDVFFIPHLPSSSQSTLEELIYYLGEEKSSNLSGSELLRIINRKLLNIAKNNRHAIIVIDEAQLLNQESLEMIRLILNFQHNNSFLCTIILAGQPELLENINKIKPLEQRIAIKYHLKPLNGESTIAYIKFRIKKAGSDKPIFTNEALDRILHYSSGIPRKINNICNMSLLVSYSIKKDIITPDIIEQVVEE